jgi:hypothetical protein
LIDGYAKQAPAFLALKPNREAARAFGNAGFDTAITEYEIV